MRAVAFDPELSEAQKAAIVGTYRPYVVTSSEVARLAAAGKLRGLDGKRLPAFDVGETTVRTIAQRVRRRGDLEGWSADTAQRLFARLARDAQRDVTQAKTPQERQAAARAVREVEALRGELAKLPERRGAGALGRAMLEAARASPEPEPRPDPEPPDVAQVAPEPEPERLTSTCKSSPEPEPETDDERLERIKAEIRAEMAEIEAQMRAAEAEQAAQRAALASRPVVIHDAGPPMPGDPSADRRPGRPRGRRYAENLYHPDRFSFGSG